MRGYEVLNGCKNPYEVPSIYKGKTIFLCGNGPSLKELEGEKRLQFYPVVGVNHASFLNYVDIMFIADARFYWMWKDKIDKFKGEIFTINIHIPGKWESISDKFKTINVSKSLGLTRNYKVVRYNKNGGCASINFCRHLGAKRIILCGFNMQNVNGEAHAIKDFDYRENKYIKSDYMKKGRSKELWERINNDAKSLGVEIFNATTNSVIPIIKKIDLNSILNGKIKYV